MPPPDGPRPKIIGADSGPEAPFPLRMKGEVVKGFGRGSKELGIPTANLPVEGVEWIEKAESGVYFGWAGIQLPNDHPDLRKESRFHQVGNWRLYPMVMSIGFNPFYGNTVRSAEVHVMHDFEKDFYGSQMAIRIEGFIRPEYDYVDVESLIVDIKEDIEVARRSLERGNWKRGLRDEYLKGGEVEKEGGEHVEME